MGQRKTLSLRFELMTSQLRAGYTNSRALETVYDGWTVLEKSDRVWGCSDGEK